MSDCNRIWQPTVAPNSVPLPYPSGDSSSSHFNKHQTYTTTSLAKSNSQIDQINREILRVTQAHNSTAKPFSNQGRSTVDNAPMAPKLIHQQYNSPIELYSMDNIRKTIDAHTEMIAPGVKGINFMKYNEPVNRQSEVYKLVMEEENKGKCQTHRAEQGPSPACGLSSGEQSCSTSATDQQQEFARHQCPDSRQTGAEHLDCSSQTKSDGNVITMDTRPKCCECGQPIVGPFAKLKDRFIHPHCFNCSTCGASLKNSGYFIINEKLYCDIHARHVANVMQLNFNFEPNKLSHQPAPNPVTLTERQRRDVSVQQSRSASAIFSDQSQANLPSRSGNAIRMDEQQITSNRSNFETRKDQSCNLFKLSGCASSSGSCGSTAANKSTTISTMFSKCSGAAGPPKHCCSVACNQRGGRTGDGEIVWTWRPSSSYCERHQVQNTSESKQQTSSTTRSDRLLASRSGHLQSAVHFNENVQVQPINRSPICHQCQAHIHGPYVLAGKSTWCKPCSLVYFVCSSCKRSLLDCGFIEKTNGVTAKNAVQYYCEVCYENYLAPVCSKCLMKVKGDCLNALGKQWHPNCFVCGHCRQPFGNSSFYLEDDVPYCQRDWNLLFTTKCSSCSYPIEAGDKWIDALSKSYHTDCFRCSKCQIKLEGSTFYCKGGKPLCKTHAK